MSGTRTALVLGATGGIGGEVAAALLRRGWAVRGLHRDPAAAAARAPWLKGIAWIRGDAMVPAEVVAAARDATLVVHAVNPPLYQRWGELVLPMLEASIAAARGSGARLLLPGTIYNFGPETFPVLLEGAPQRPRTRKGAIRAEMERRLRQAAESEGVRALVVRAGDFFGPRAGNSWFSQGMVTPGRPVRTVRHPGKAGVGHAWAYLPDAAEAMARLAELEGSIDSFESLHFAGYWDADGTALVEAIRRAVVEAGGVEPRLRRVPWTLVGAASPFVPLFRELWDMRHLWREPLRLDNSRLLALLGTEPCTPIGIAVRDTLAGLGCLDVARAGDATHGLDHPPDGRLET